MVGLLKFSNNSGLKLKKNRFSEAIVKHEGLSPHQTPFRIKKGSRMNKWVSMYDDTLTIELDPEAKKPKGRENFLFLKNKEDVIPAVEEQFRRYNDRNPGITIKEAVEKFDHTGSKGKLKFLKEQGYNEDDKVQDVIPMERPQRNESGLFDLSSLNPFSVKSASAGEIPKRKIVDDLGIFAQPTQEISATQPIQRRKIVDDLGIFGKPEKEGILKATGKGLVSFGATLPQAIGSLIKEQGDKALNTPGVMEKIFASGSKMGIMSAPFQFIPNIIKMTKGEEEVTKFGQNIVDKNREYLDKLGIKRPEGKVEGFAYDVGSGLGSVTTAVGLAALTKSPAAVGGLFGAIQKGHTYEELKEKGISTEDASHRSTLAGLAEGSLEFVGLHTFLKMAKVNGKVGRALLRIGEESIQEGSQTGTEAFIMRDVRNKNVMDVLKDVGYSAMLGAIVSAPVSIVVTMAEKDGAIDKLKKEGIDEERAENLVNSVVEKTMQSPEAGERIVEVTNEILEEGVEIPKGDITITEPKALKEVPEHGEIDIGKVKDISDFTAQAQKGGELYGEAAGKLRAPSGNLKSVQELGGPKAAQTLFDKVSKGEKLTPEQAEKVKGVVEEWDGLHKNIETEEAKVDEEIAKIRDLYEDITDEDILTITEEIEQEELWDEEKLDRAIEKYSEKKGGVEEAEVKPEEEVKPKWFEGATPLKAALEKQEAEYKPLIEEAKKYDTAEEFVRKAKIMVPIENVIPTEGHTAELMKKEKARETKEPIRVEINKDGKMQIQDGNHRYFEAIERGEKNIEIQFNDQAPELNFEGEFDRLSEIFNKSQDIKKKEVIDEEKVKAKEEKQKEIVKEDVGRVLTPYEKAQQEMKEWKERVDVKEPVKDQARINELANSINEGMTILKGKNTEEKSLMVIRSIKSSQSKLKKLDPNHPLIKKEAKQSTFKQRLQERSKEIEKREKEVGKIKIEDLENLSDEELGEVIDSGLHMGITKGKARQILDTRKEDKLREKFPIKISMSDIPYDSAYQAYAHISFSPEKRAVTEQTDYLNTMESFYEELKTLAKTEEQKDILVGELSSFKEGYIKRALAVLGAKGRTLSPMITGPAKFPTARNQKALNTESRRVEELFDFIEKAKTRARKRINQQEIEDRGGELEVAKQELAKEEKNVQLMKDVNKLLRKKGISKERKITEIIKMSGWKESTVEKLFEPYLGKVGFASFQLTNANARIKRLRAKVTSMEKAEDLSGQEIIGEYEEVKIINNFDEERVQLDFEEKPGEELRGKLKKSGWRWSPRQEVWQRKNTLNGINSAKQIAKEAFGEIEEKVSGKEESTGLAEYYSVKLKDKKGEATIPFEWEADIPVKKAGESAFQDHVDYYEKMQLPEDSKIREIKKDMRRVAGLRLAGKMTTQEANKMIQRLRGDLITAAGEEGVSIVRTKKGKLKLGMREKEGIYVPADFSEYGKYKDFTLRAGGLVDTERMIQEIDGSLSVRQKEGTEGQAGPAERYILWRTRDITIQKMNFNEEWSEKLNNIFRGIKPDSKEDYLITKALTSGDYKGLNPILIKKVTALREFYDALLDHQNKIREMRGQESIPFRRNYSPQILARAVVWGNLFNKNKGAKEIQKDAFLPDYVMPNKPINPHEMAREGGIDLNQLMKSSYGLARRYLNTAERDIFNTSIIQNNKAFISQFEALGYKKTADALAKWNAEGYAGVKASLDRVFNLPNWVNKSLRYTNAVRNLAVFPWRFAFNTGNQIKSLSFTVGRYGYLDTLNGMLQYMNPKNREQLRDIYSYRVKTAKAGRVSRQDNNNTLDGIIDEKRSAIERWNDAGTFILESMEKTLTGSSIFAAYNQGKRRGLKGEALNQFASAGGSKTQSMYNDEDRPGMLRNLIIKSIAPYQTFKFELLNSIRELAGKTGTPPDDRREAVAALLRFVSSAILLRLLAEFASKKDSREIINPLPFAQWTTDPIIDKAIGRSSYGKDTALPSFTGMATELTDGIVRSIKGKDVDPRSPSNRKLRNTLMKYVPGLFGVGGGMQAANTVDTLIGHSQGGIYSSTGKLLFRMETEDIARGIYSGAWTTRGGLEYKEKKFVYPKFLRDYPFRYGVFGKKKIYPTTKKEWAEVPDSMKVGNKILLRTEKKPRRVIFIDTPSGKRIVDEILKKDKSKK